MKVKYLQEGGAMAPEDPAMAGGAPAEAGMAPEAGAPAGGEEEMMQQLYQMAQEIVSQMGPEAAMMLAQAIAEVAQGGAAGAEQMPAPEEQPVYKMGGKLVRGRR